MFNETFWAIEPRAFDSLQSAARARIENHVHIDRAAMRTGTPKPILARNGSPAATAAAAGLPIEIIGNAGLVHLSGVMLKNPPNWLADVFELASTLAVKRAIEAAAADAGIETIVLRIDSPGGTVDGTADLADAVATAAKVKPVIAQGDGTIASAAYWVASQASQIVAGRTNMIGSVGVRLTIFDVSKMLADDGIRTVSIDTGEFKSTGEPGTPLTANQQSYLQSIIDGIMGEFRRTVGRGRLKLAGSAFDRVADGRVFLADDALKLGLIDDVRSLDATIARARRDGQRQGETRLARAMIRSMDARTPVRDGQTERARRLVDRMAAGVR